MKTIKITMTRNTTHGTDIQFHFLMQGSMMMMTKKQIRFTGKLKSILMKDVKSEGKQIFKKKLINLKNRSQRFLNNLLILNETWKT